MYQPTMFKRPGALDAGVMSNLNVRKIAIVGGSATIGASQTFLLREYVDKSQGVLIPQLGKFGTASALAGIVLGGLATAIGAANFFGLSRKIPMLPTVNRDMQTIALSYGIPALATGILSAQFAPVAQVAAQASAPRSYVRVKPVRAKAPVTRVSARPVVVHAAAPAQAAAVIRGKKGLMSYDVSNGVF